MQQLNSKPLDQQEDVELEVDNQTESSGKIMWYVVTPYNIKEIQHCEFGGQLKYKEEAQDTINEIIKQGLIKEEHIPFFICLILYFNVATNERMLLEVRNLYGKSMNPDNYHLLKADISTYFKLKEI